ncbi:MAG: MarC family protein [Candidatus Omnitrophica bacterium]|nr:MarC family protein [Candidatus Omnitrophota bacterium]MDD4013475.1 MarC family protein [Candidatus Omnitrophota bacterium]
MIEKIVLAFIPIFVAIDAIGILPIFISLTEGEAPGVRAKVVLQSVVTAFCLAFFFIILGKWILSILGITMGDFAIAGGILLFVLAVNDIMSSGERRRVPATQLGAVPLGTPLMVGPAVLTASLLMLGQYGFIPTIVSVSLNILIAGIVFLSAEILLKVMGEAGAKALSKVMSLLLASFAVMMVRKGIFLIMLGQ